MFQRFPLAMALLTAETWADDTYILMQDDARFLYNGIPSIFD